ncbi:MAG: DUF4149 domain-containing protein [Acidobacteriota bacterium]
MKLLSWVWLGLVIGVSFLATPAKFMATTLTRPTALEVGRYTFRVLDRLEWVLAAVLLVLVYRLQRHRALTRPLIGWTAALFVILAVQSFYYLPMLDVRVGLVMAGETLPPSHAHTFSGALEVLQAVTLFMVGHRAPDPRGQP